MGIAAYPVECRGCRAKILLRLAVGLDERQPFFYVCPSCKAATRAALVWHGGADTSLELSDGRLLPSSEECDSALSINPEFPSMPTARSMMERGGSAFLMFSELLSPQALAAYLDVTRRMRKLLKAKGPALDRLTTYYLNRDWSHFDNGLKEFVPRKARKISEEWQRDDIIHRVYDVLLIPLLALDKTPYYPEMKAEFNAMLTDSRAHYAAVVAFAKAEAETGLYCTLQRDLFEQLARYLQLLSAVLPGLVCNMLPAEHQGKVETLRLFRDDYEVLRDLYIQVFETCHKALRWVIGTVNADANGDHNKFVAPSTNIDKKAPSNLNVFGRLVSADKRKWLILLPSWNRHWDVLFDRDLRNDIGHASARHELPTGLIRRDKSHALPYTGFVQRAQRLVHCLITTANAMKMIRIYSLLT